jgi:hypothetical protein
MNRRAPERRVRARAVGHILVAQVEVRGASHRSLLLLYAHRASAFAGRSGAPQRGVPFVPPHSSFLWDRAETFRRFFQVAVVHAVGQRAGAAHAGVAYDKVDLGPPLYVYSYFRNRRRSNGASDCDWQNG